MASKSRAKAAQAERRIRAVSAVTEFLRHTSDPTRLAALLLLEAGERPYGAIVEATAKSAPAVSCHLAQLFRGDVVTRRRQGRLIIYELTERGRVLAELARKVGEWLR